MTPGRIFVLLILAVGGVGSIVNGAPFYMRMLYLGVLLIALAWLLTVFSLRGIKVERKARSLRAAVGDIFEEHYEIINSSLIPKLWLEISNVQNEYPQSPYNEPRGLTRWVDMLSLPSP